MASVNNAALGPRSPICLLSSFADPRSQRRNEETASTWREPGSPVRQKPAFRGGAIGVGLQYFVHLHASLRDDLYMLPEDRSMAVLMSQHSKRPRLPIQQTPDKLIASRQSRGAETSYGRLKLRNNQRYPGNTGDAF